MFHFRHLTNNFKCQPKKNCCGKQVLVPLHLMRALYLVTIFLKAVKEENCLWMGSSWFYLMKDRSLCGQRAAFVLLLLFMSVWFSFHIHSLPFGWNLEEKAKVNISHFACINGSYCWKNPHHWANVIIYVRRDPQELYYYVTTLLYGCTNSLQLPSSKLFTRH